MRKEVIKSAFMAASLGLALFVSSPAFAETDELLGVCVVDRDGDLRLIQLHTSSEAVVPPEITIGLTSCLDAIKAVKAAGWEPIDEGTFDTELVSLKLSGGGPVGSPVGGILGLIDGRVAVISIFALTCRVPPCRRIVAAGSE